jgi:hypothetical protein
MAPFMDGKIESTDETGIFRIGQVVYADIHEPSQE